MYGSHAPHPPPPPQQHPYQYISQQKQYATHPNYQSSHPHVPQLPPLPRPQHLQIHSALDPSFMASFKRLVSHKGSCLDLDMTQRVDWLSRRAYFLDEPATRPPTCELTIACPEIAELIILGRGDGVIGPDADREAVSPANANTRVENAGNVGMQNIDGNNGDDDDDDGRGENNFVGGFIDSGVGMGFSPGQTNLKMIPEAVDNDFDNDYHDAANGYSYRYGEVYGDRDGDTYGLDRERRNSEDTASSTYHDHEAALQFIANTNTLTTGNVNNTSGPYYPKHTSPTKNKHIPFSTPRPNNSNNNSSGWPTIPLSSSPPFPIPPVSHFPSHNLNPNSNLNPGPSTFPAAPAQTTSPPSTTQYPAPQTYAILHISTLPSERPITVRDVLSHLDRFLYTDLPPSLWPSDPLAQERIEAAHRLRVKHCMKTHGTKGFTRNRRLSELSNRSWGPGSGSEKGLGLGGGFGRSGSVSGSRAVSRTGSYNSQYYQNHVRNQHLASSSNSYSGITRGVNGVAGSATNGKGTPTKDPATRGIGGFPSIGGGIKDFSFGNGFGYGIGAGGYSYNAPLCFMQVVECARRDEEGKLVGRDRKVAARIDWLGGKFFFQGLKKAERALCEEWEGAIVRNAIDNYASGGGGDGVASFIDADGNVHIDFVLNMEGPWARRRKM